MAEENQNPEIEEVEYEPEPSQYFADFDDAGNIAGFYVDTINDDIPESALPISEDEWRTYSADASKYKLDGETIREKTQQELEDEAAARPPAPKTPLQELQDENKELRQAIAELTMIVTMGGA